MKRFVRTAVSPYGDSYYALVHHEDEDYTHWYGPFRNKKWANIRGQEIAASTERFPGRKILNRSAILEL